MSSKSARRRQRELRRERLDAAPVAADLDLEDVSCADADLAQLAGLLDDAFEILNELANSAAATRRRWPADPDLGELDVMLEEARGAALASRDRLGLMHDRIQRFRKRGDHFHVLGGRVVRMVPVESRTSVEHPDDNIPF